MGVTTAGEDLAVYDHLRLAEADALPGADATPGVYRVVGTGGDTVTLLRVGDADGRRINTGTVVTVDDDRLSAFDPADNPDGNRPPGAILANAFDGLSWQLRTFGSSLADRPLLSALAVAVVAAGLFGDQFVAGPEWAFSVAIFAGSLVIAAIGSNLV